MRLTADFHSPPPFPVSLTLCGAKDIQFRPHGRFVGTCQLFGVQLHSIVRFSHSVEAGQGKRKELLGRDLKPVDNVIVGHAVLPR